ncbi:hypothetical protein pb186bvf_005274 [Paramecium bursaria]
MHIEDSGQRPQQQQYVSLGAGTEDRPSYQNLQPLRNRNQPMWKRAMFHLDLFAFLPTPRTYPVSTKRSLYGSLILFFLFLGYIIYSFIDFYFYNIPKITQFSQQDKTTQNTTVPEIAFQFLWGSPFYSEAINDPKIFRIYMEETTKSKDPGIADSQRPIPLKKCNPTWIPADASKFDFQCPEVQLNMSGVLYSTDKFVYPRIQIKFCNITVGNINNCETEEVLRNKSAGGRFFLYMKNEALDKNFITGKQTEGVTYLAYQYFLVYGLYNRVEIVMQKENVTTTGNFLTEFKTKQEQFIQPVVQTLYVSNVTFIDNGYVVSAFQIWIRLDSEIKIVQVTKVTTVDVISKWGAFWGVLFGVFALYFLRFNSKQFYDKNPNWATFDEPRQVQPL